MIGFGMLFILAAVLIGLAELNQSGDLPAQFSRWLSDTATNYGLGLISLAMALYVLLFVALCVSWMVRRGGSRIDG